MNRPGFPRTRRVRRQRETHGAGWLALAIAAAMLAGVVLVFWNDLARGAGL